MGFINKKYKIMKITGIIILFDTSNQQFNYRSGVASVKNELTRYFGIKNIEDSDENMPVFAVSCEVTEEDLKKIESKFTCLSLLALQGESDKIKNMSERIISLT